MAFDVLALKNPKTGELRMAPVGYSWTTLFFGPLPPLFRSDWKFFFVILVASGLTFGFAGVIFSFIYNKLYIKDLIFLHGFRVTGSRNDDLQLASNRLGIELPLFDA